jgi:hypothetical protein
VTPHIGGEIQKHRNQADCLATEAKNASFGTLRRFPESPKLSVNQTQQAGMQFVQQRIARVIQVESRNALPKGKGSPLTQKYNLKMSQQIPIAQTEFQK